jgi:hypothetical protein
MQHAHDPVGRHAAGRPPSRRDRLRAGLAGAALAAAAFLTTAGTPPTVAVTFEADGPLVIRCGETLSVHVAVDAAATDLRGMSFVAEFADSIVTPVEVSAGPLLDGISCGDAFVAWVNQPPDALAWMVDSVRVDLAGLGCSAIGPGRIATIRFTAAMEDTFGTTTLSFRSLRLRDSLNDPIPSTGGTAALANICIPISVEPTTWGGTKALWRVDP